ncbi:hypothetical protein PVAG01_03581 [Phlyctema vagabunda]|uniref:Uncharacterized protein n=1 Tax=Phlyctema vagabunda TaxID=108571 RepID=A0ABR4PLU0_9HELO
MPEVPSIQVQDLPPTPTRLANKDTGFPEPLSTERNTTLHHPDADTSQGASIEGPEISLSRTHSRKISFLHKRKLSGASGKINPADYESPESAGLYDNIQYEDGSREKKDPKALAKDAQQRDDIVDAPGREELDEDLRSAEERDEQGYKEGERKKGILRKVHLHKV